MNRINIYKYELYFLLILAVSGVETAFSQPLKFITKPAEFSTRLNDEFSPVFYKNGIVYCTNQGSDGLVSYSQESGNMFKIFYCAKNEKFRWSVPSLFSKELSSGFNDGPATFNETGTVIWFSRNNNAKRDLGKDRGDIKTLGLFSAENQNGIWTDLRPFPFNDIDYNNTTPALSPDGSRLYFSSDRPGGFGGMDLYYCEKKGDQWSDPINLGARINTEKSESFPFMSKSGKLFFSSDGHPGFGGKDLFYTIYRQGEWQIPVHLDSSINSSFDEFGILTDSLFETGFFSTNRLRSDDIFEFSLNPVTFPTCYQIENNNYCFTFYDENQKGFNNDSVSYEWDFGQNIKKVGKEVGYCFPGPGQYLIRLTITDKLTGDTLVRQAEYEVNLGEREQAEILSYGFGFEGVPLKFYAETSGLKDVAAQSYYWDTGETFKPGPDTLAHTFQEKGIYTVKLGLFGQPDSQGIASKHCYETKIRIYNKDEYTKMHVGSYAKLPIIKPEAKTRTSQTLAAAIYLMNDLSQSQKEMITRHFDNRSKDFLVIDEKGLLPDSSSLLNSLSKILRNDESIRLEVYIRARSGKTDKETQNITKSWSREIDFYLRNRNNRDNIQCIVKPAYFDSNHSVEMGDADGFMEFVFMNSEREVNHE